MAYVTDERYLFPTNINSSPSSSSMLDRLPTETLRQIFKYLSYKDVQSLEKIEQFSDVIERYKVFLPREPKHFGIFSIHTMLIYNLSSIDKRTLIPTVSIDVVSEMIRRYSIEALEVNNTNGMKDMEMLTEEIFPHMIQCRQRNITSLSLIGIDIPREKSKILRYFFSSFINRDCKKLIIDNVSLSRLFNHHIFKSCKKLTNVKWIVKDTDDNEKIICGDLVMENFINHVRHTSPLKMESLFANMEMISPRSIVMFLDTWLSISSPSPFSIVIEKCDGEWMEEFANECIINNLSNFNMQISSNKSYFSHVKMVYNINSSITKVTFNSIIDMPARHINQRQSHGRFYRDF